MSIKIVAIIPAHNEEQTVANVIRVLKQSKEINEIIVVSDGSTDKTTEVSVQAGATVYSLKHQGGKGEALMYALKKTDADIIVFFDADLIGLNEESVSKLIKPVVSGEKVMNVGLRDRGRIGIAIARHMPLISGERALKREILEAIPDKYMNGFMIETALNYYCRSHGFSYGTIVLKGVTIRRKYQKVNLLTAMIQYVKMFIDVAKAMLIVRSARLFGKF